MNEQTLWHLGIHRCARDGCDRFAQFGYVACRKHVRERRQLIRRVGMAGAANIVCGEKRDAR